MPSVILASLRIGSFTVPENEMFGTLRGPVSLMLLSILPACNAGPDAADKALPIPAASVESGGVSAVGIAALNDRLQALVDERRVAGMVTMLSRHGTIVQQKSFGRQDIEAGVAMAPDTIFRIYSMTKPVTGVAMMILYERGLWALDDPVSKFVPQFAGLEVAVEDDHGKVTRVRADHEMTMRELMTHTGGLTYGFFSKSAVDAMYAEAKVLDRGSSLETMIGKLARIPLRQQPGSLWHYSVSVDVQGYIVERLSGQTLPEFFAEHIFEPLGMSDTGFYVPADKASRLARQVYDYGPNRELVPSAGLIGDYSSPPGLPSGGGGLVSTAADYMRFAQMLLNGGELDGQRILEPETVVFMHRNHAPTTQAEGTVQLGPGMGFGMDVAVFVDPAAAEAPVGAGTFSWAGAAGTWFWIDPVNDLAFVGMAQQDYFDIADFPKLTQQWVYQALTD
jgi:CubicO group peptidase (beta-lactamase class C family)